MPATDSSEDQLGAPAATEDEAPAVAGDLVELEDGAYAVVVSIDPTTVLRLGAPERHEVPFSRKVR